jgi:hypothetical protein
LRHFAIQTKTCGFPKFESKYRGFMLRASPAVEGPQAKIRRYLAPDGCKFRPGEAHVSSGEPRGIFEFKLNMTKKVKVRRNLIKFRDIYINRAKYIEILHI